MANTIQMTQTGYDELVKELEELKTVKRSEIAEKIKVARGYGDLSENSEYDAAKNEQAEIEARIAVLEEQLKQILIELSGRQLCHDLIRCIRLVRPLI